MAIKTYEAFRAPSPYEQERLRAERQRRYAELLEQQAMEPEGEFTYQGIRAMPSPLPAVPAVRRTDASARPSTALARMGLAL